MEFCYGIKDFHYYWKASKNIPLFSNPVSTLIQTFFIYFSQKANWNRLKAEAAVRIQLSPVKPDIRQICRSWNYGNFSGIYYYYYYVFIALS